MRVNVYETVEIDDKQRIRIASVLDGKASKRQATRDELKAFLWHEGDEWATILDDLYGELPEVGGEEPESPSEDESLI